MKTRMPLIATFLVVGVIPLHAATIPVNNTADSGGGSLREALASAANGDTIDASGVSGTITLTTGELLVTNSVDILGPGPNNLAVNGNFPNTTNRVFRIGSNTVVSISSLTITHGAFYEDDGAGIHNSAALTVSNCTITGNDTDYGAGGGIYNLGVLIVNSSTLSSNDAGYGGGIYNAGGTVTVSDSAFNGNGAFEGGGIDNGGGTGTVSNCTFSGNGFGAGGGIANAGVLTVNNSKLISGGVVEVGGGILNAEGATAAVSNCTVSGNSAAEGGGIENNGMLTILNSTISSNSAGNGGGIRNAFTLAIANSTISGNSGSGIRNDGSSLSLNDPFNFALLTIVNSTLSGNSGGGIVNSGNNGGDFFGATVEIGSTILNAGGLGGAITNLSGKVFSGGYNLSSDDGSGFLTATGDQTNTPPLLGPLQDNGGPTFTHALLPGSPCINAGDPSFSGLDFDQRGHGFARVVCGRIDIGAFEVQDTTPPHITCPANIVTNATSSAGVSVSFAPTASDNCSLASVTCSPASGSTFAIGTTTVTCRAIDGSANTNTCPFSIHVKGAAEQINDLIALIRSLPLKPGTANALVPKLQDALRQLAKGHTKGHDKEACHHLTSFSREVNNKLKDRHFMAAQANQMLAAANRIRAVLACP